VARWEKNSLPDIAWPLAMLRCIKKSLNISKIVVEILPPHPDNVTSQAKHPNLNNISYGQVPQYQYRFLLYLLRINGYVKEYLGTILQYYLLNIILFNNCHIIAAVLRNHIQVFL
jgi:hypothetical protein